MRATRRVYTVALGATGLVLVGSMAGAAAYAASSGAAGTTGNSWGPGWGSGPGGMMGGWGSADSGDAPEVTLDQAKEIADQWVATNQPGATADAGFQMPMGYVFVVSRDGTVVARSWSTTTPARSSPAVRAARAQEAEA